MNGRPTMPDSSGLSGSDYPDASKHHQGRFRLHWWSGLWALLEFLVFVAAVIAVAAPYWIDPPDPIHHVNSLKAHPNEPLGTLNHAGLWEACFADMNDAGTAVRSRSMNCCTRQVHHQLYRDVANQDYRRYVKAVEGFAIGFGAFTLGKLLWGFLAFSTTDRGKLFITFITLALINAVLQLICAAITLAMFGWILRDVGSRAGFITGLGAFRHLVGWCYWLFLATSATALASTLLLCCAFS